MRIRAVGCVCLALLLAGCALEHRWAKPGASYQDYARDRFACIEASRSRSTSLYANSTSGTGRSREIYLGAVFSACMEAHGYRPSENGFAPDRPLLLH